MKKLLITSLIIFFLPSAILFAQKNKPVYVSTHTAEIKTMTDAEYPDNNNIGYRNKLAGIYAHNTISFFEKQNGNFDILITPANEKSDSIFLSNINLLEIMPTIAEHIKSDSYLTHIALMNQEWNRIQAKFTNEYYTVKGTGDEKNNITRVDIANNCLGAGLWEMSMFATENNKERVYFQSWFTFPAELYKNLFEKRNDTSFETWKDMLTNYKTPPSQKINLDILRTINSEQIMPYENLNAELYPVIGERQTKAKNILYPKIYTSINDFLTDSTAYASFVSLGMYNKKDVRHTSLGNFRYPGRMTYSRTTSTNKEKTQAVELRLSFQSADKTKTTQLIIGGVQPEKMPALNMNNHSMGFQRSMGIGNHSFNSSYEEILAFPSKQNPYYLFVTDAEDNWLDSHLLGIDGVLLFRDIADASKLHVMLLSFERHTFAGHFIVDVPRL
ncbi:MAG: hypothetical protein H7Y00_08985 [Fimbriimonadaceae bacterium]|nr:hypothetical protein [Chitinophagales bacterium]